MVKPVKPWPNPASNQFVQAPNGMMVPMMPTEVKYRYDKKFALFPTICKGGYWVWFNHYYKKYLVFSYEEIRDVCYYLCKLTTADAVVEKLTDSIDFR
jgi:hypothetical protein